MATLQPIGRVPLNSRGSSSTGGAGCPWSTSRRSGRMSTTCWTRDCEGAAGHLGRGGAGPGHAEQLPDEPLIGAVTLPSCPSARWSRSDPAEAARRQLVPAAGGGDFEPLPFDASCARAFGLVAASLRASNRKVGPRALDALPSPQLRWPMGCRSSRRIRGMLWVSTAWMSGGQPGSDPR